MCETQDLHHHQMHVLKCTHMYVYTQMLWQEVTESRHFVITVLLVIYRKL